jgi:hypothetical protein
MAGTSQSSPAIAPGFELGLEFLRARRAQNLSWMRLVEQSLGSAAQLSRSAGAAGGPYARVWSSQAAFVHATARVYGTVTAHLAR